MDISSISNSISPITLNSSEHKVSDDNSFQNMLNNTISKVNNEQVEAYDAMEGIATGKVTNLQEAVQQIEEAELSMKLALETKNKAVSAYKQIMSMQI